jgi:hypothetical protein
VGSRSVAAYLYPILQVLADGIEENLAARRIPAAGAPKVTLVHSTGNEFRESGLFQCGRVPIAEPLRRGERSNEAFGSNQLADPEGREDSARKGSGVDYATFVIEALQGLERLSVVPKFSVVVVFDDHGVTAFGPREKIQTSG